MTTLCGACDGWAAGTGSRGSVAGAPGGSADGARPVSRPVRVPRPGRRVGPSGVPRVPKDSTAPGAPQGDSVILPGGIAVVMTSRALAGPGASRGGCRLDARRRPRARPRARLTPLLGPAYHPPDDERATRPLGARRVCVPLGVETDAAPRPDGEDPAQSR
jgi:hypothetical protein